MMKNAVVALLFLGIACGGNNRDADPEDAAALPSAAGTLASSLSVEVHPDTVRLVFHVTNPTNEPLTLEFSSGQRYDFAIRSGGGDDLWRWSADKSFMQALGAETLAPGATVQYVEVWPTDGRKGSFVAAAELTSTSHPVQESAQFEIR